VRLVRDLHDRTGEVQSKEVPIRYLQFDYAPLRQLGARKSLC